MQTETEHARWLPTIPSGLWPRDARQSKRIGNTVVVLQEINRSFIKLKFIKNFCSSCKTLSDQVTRNPRYHSTLYLIREIDKRHYHFTEREENASKYVSWNQAIRMSVEVARSQLQQWIVKWCILTTDVISLPALILTSERTQNGVRTPTSRPWYNALRYSTSCIPRRQSYNPDKPLAFYRAKSSYQNMWVDIRQSEWQWRYAGHHCCRVGSEVVHLDEWRSYEFRSNLTSEHN
jgi:hypothetical protein